MNENDREYLEKFFSRYLGVSCFWKTKINMWHPDFYVLSFRHKPKNNQTLYLSNWYRILIDDSFDLAKFFKIYGGKEILLYSKHYKIPNDILEAEFLYATF